MKRTFGSASEEGNWSAVYVAANPFEADLVRSLLEEEGIATFSEPDLGALFGKSTGLRILVPRDEESPARDLIHAYHRRRHLNVISLADYLPERREGRLHTTWEWMSGVWWIALVLLVVVSLLVVFHPWS